MLIDEVKIKIRGGNGGDGVASFKNAKMSLGPTGADGGSGGDVYLEGVSDLGALRQFRHKKSFHAEDGERGSNHNRDGKNGEDLTLKVPVGTVAKNLGLRTEVEITKIGEKILIAHGARGGHGNFYFRSSTNISPREWEPGNKAREFDFVLELKLIADVGLIGFPNAGKSSLLNELTAAKSRVANYRFTTLEPSLGAFYDLILADLPGLIEGASEGKGLGTKFLRHISRCRTLFHLISSESENLEDDYRVIREELETYDKELLKKPEYVFLSKVDLDDPKITAEKIKKLKKVCKNPIAISVVSKQGLDEVKKILAEVTKQKTVIAE